ncbi:hypothetical protein Hanom_Chr09g00841391 [Helianthus anomalus]
MKEKKTSSKLCEKILIVSNNLKSLMRKGMKQLPVGDQDDLIVFIILYHCN